MYILSIETSCDETAVSIVRAEGDFPNARYEILGNGLFSQADTHAPYGGVFPALAKREHIKNIIPMLHSALSQAELLESGSTAVTAEQEELIVKYLERETGMAQELIDWVQKHDLPTIDLIAVTNGPGLEPALWVGVNFAKALSAVFSCPVVPVNHMEGHVLASVYDVVEDDVLAPVVFPALALLISGGHTELVLMEDWTTYRIVGQTRDDAVGEAFDKVARLLGLPYPGGPEIELRAKQARKENVPPYKADMPRPMLHSKDYDFSFSGLKTAVRYAIEDKKLTEQEIGAVARDFSDAVVEVLLAKTMAATEAFSVRTLIVGGGVSASQFIRDVFTKAYAEIHPEIEVYFPHRDLSTDNSIMIALTGHAHAATARSGSSIARIRADGNLSIATIS